MSLARSFKHTARSIADSQGEPLGPSHYGTAMIAWFYVGVGVGVAVALLCVTGFWLAERFPIPALFVVGLGAFITVLARRAARLPD